VQLLRHPGVNYHRNIERSQRFQPVILPVRLGYDELRAGINLAFHLLKFMLLRFVWIKCNSQLNLPGTLFDVFHDSTDVAELRLKSYRGRQLRQPLVASPVTARMYFAPHPFHSFAYLIEILLCMECIQMQ